ncbi:hypothetical protein Glove_132g17 [Diversispora epigaea]|uniref:Uncharacterized protein n=1 Tax=Diversispora epigaea TaxID=1348612 RepID=A0A397J465_9GLOM|nr:hypothetical protein Glove_132g17 [Diversispora epigaea]
MCSRFDPRASATFWAVNKCLKTTYPVLYSKIMKLDLGPNVPKFFSVFPTVAINFNGIIDISLTKLVVYIKQGKIVPLDQTFGSWKSSNYHWSKKINAISIVYLGMKEDCWIARSELKTIVEQAVALPTQVITADTYRYVQSFIHFEGNNKMEMFDMPPQLLLLKDKEIYYTFGFHCASQGELVPISQPSQQ